MCVCTNLRVYSWRENGLRLLMQPRVCVLASKTAVFYLRTCVCVILLPRHTSLCFQWYLSKRFDIEAGRY